MPTTYHESDQVLTRTQVVWLLMAAGATDEEIMFLTSVARPESGYHTGVLADDEDDYSFGLWQINLKPGVRTAADLGLSSDEELYNPLTNAKAAISVYREQGQGAWGGRKAVTARDREETSVAYQEAKANPHGINQWRDTSSYPQPGVTGDTGATGPGTPTVDENGNIIVQPGFGGTGALPTTDAEILEYIEANYGSLSIWMNHPEIGQKLREAAQKGWGIDRLYASLQGTEWWRNTSANEREWQQLIAEDKATADNERIRQKANISNIVQRLGIPMDETTLNNLTEDSLKWGWQNWEIIDAVLRFAPTNPMEGDLGAFANQIKSLGAEYLLDIDDAQAGWLAQEIASEELTLDGVAAKWQAQAKAKVPWLAELIDQGVTPMDYFDPIRQVVANTLEMNPETLDIVSPTSQWAGIVEGVDDGKGGKRGLTFTEAANWARQHDNGRTYAQTGGAMQVGTQVADSILKMFGRR